MLAFASAIHGAMTAATEDGRDSVGRLMHSIAALLLIGAWATGHATSIGWGCLAVAAAMEIGLRARAREIERRIASQQAARGANPAIQDGSDPMPGDEGAIRSATVKERRATSIAEDGSEFSENSSEREIPGAVSASAPSFVTVALLREAHQVTGDVFVASVRRSGRRDAQLTSAGTTATWQARIGEFTIEGMSQRSAWDGAALAEAAAQTFDWPDALQACREHAGHVRLVTRAPAGASRTELVAVHRLAHAAIAEFAPVCGVLWEGARLLRPVARGTAQGASREDTVRHMPRGQESAREAVHDAMETCINFRVTPLEGSEPQAVASDTVGLHAFGLPDLEIVTPGEPDERIARVLYHLAEEFFARGCDWQDGDERTIGSYGRWRCERRRSTLAPGREILALSPKEC